MSKFKYITLSQLMSSVEDDFSKYADSGLIDSSKYIKIIRGCNEKLGLRIYASKQIVLKMENGKAELPQDFYKVEMAIGVTHSWVNTMLPIGDGPTQVMTQPDDLSTIQAQCLDEAGKCYWIIQKPLTQLQFKTVDFVPLYLAPSCKDQFTGYSPNWNHHKKDYEIDLSENVVKTNFDGCIYFSYLADMRDENGEDLIPFHPLINPYYEWSVKNGILENIMMNSEDDVINKLKYARNEKNLAYQDAVNFTMTKEVKEWQHMTEKRERKFFEEYYKIFY